MSIFRRFTSKLAQGKNWAARTFLRPTNVIVFSWPGTELGMASLAEQAWGGSSGLRDRLRASELDDRNGGTKSGQ